MLMKTTVKGFKLFRVDPRRSEMERWRVETEKFFLGYINKAIYRGGEGEKPITFWNFVHRHRVGYREFQITKVANTRTEIVLMLAKSNGIITNGANNVKEG